MTFGSTDLSNTTVGTNQVPVSAVYVPGTAGSNLTALEGIAVNTDSNSQKSSAARIGLLDGDDVTLGAKADAAVTGDNSGTLSAKLRGLLKIITDIWDSANHRIKVDGSGVTQPVSGTITANQGTANATPWNDNLAQVGGTSITLGTKVSASSLPVVLASDQAPIPIQHGSVVDAGNSSTATLTANSVFTGTSTSSLLYSALSIEAFADQASAAGGLSIQQSQDGTHWDTTDTFSVSASTAFNTVVNLIGQNYRIVYTNGGTGQATFRLQTIKMVADPVLPRTLTAAGALRVDGSAVTQPVSGTFWQATQPISGTVSVNALPTGSNTIGAVTQASGPWTANITQFGGTNLATGTGAGGAGIPRMTVSNDSQVQLWDGTNKANVLAATSVSNASTAQAAQLMAGAFAEQASLSAGSLNADLVVATDVSNYKWFGLQVTGVWSGTLTFQSSNDNSNWVSLAVGTLNTSTQSSTATANNVYVGQVAARWLRVRMTSYTSGTATGTLELYTAPTFPLVMTVLGTITANQGGSNWTINNAQVNGTTISVNQGTIDAGTQRVAQGGAGTGTKSNVASSASSVTILAANTSRKGAMVYNDSTQILYLDLSGGTASNSSYSVQVPAQGYFEVPGPAIYNGAITGIWAAANGNARVTEFS